MIKNNIFCVTDGRNSNPQHHTLNIIYTHLLVFAQISQFCDKDTHNYQALNLQNAMCTVDGKQSIWEILDLSDDFLGNSPVKSEDTDTTPSFCVVQRPKHMRVVLVLDVSGSMSVSELFIWHQSFPVHFEI